jgi:hypothetical protein
VTLGANTTLSADGLVWFQSTVDGTGTAGSQYLSVAVGPSGTGGNAQFDGAVGAGVALDYLTVAGTTAINGGSITTTNAVDPTGGYQTYTGAVTLGGGSDTTVTAGALVKFGNTVDDVVAGTQGLTVTGVGSSADFDGVVGTTALSFLTVNGTTLVNTTAITTTGSQTYNAPVTLSQNTVLTGTGLSLSSTVAGGGYSLTLTNSALATLGGAVTGVNVLTANGVGTLAVNNTISAGSVNDSRPRH